MKAFGVVGGVFIGVVGLLVLLVFGAGSGNGPGGGICTSGACSVGDARAVAAELVLAHDAGKVMTFPEVIYQKQIRDVAVGVASTECTPDVRVLQLALLVVQKFGSILITDIQRPCIGSYLNCIETNTPHCWVPGSAIDIAGWGGSPIMGDSCLNFGCRYRTGVGVKVAELVDFLSTVVPPQTIIGQSQCMLNDGYIPPGGVWSLIPDYCDHMHLAWRAQKAPLRVLPILPTPVPDFSLPAPVALPAVGSVFGGFLHARCS
ncbi:MAG: hypothetical protein B5766_07705 [Candidatus Lumbricidophila eiseniae]|uniref:Uncharacterized protein n=1 Tax=Candidatus Lumbricidiphila eiseniae TaxID=1969409 RepID=A0A2A6FRZ2_9MICO|nr:MAG: hypothetical protein B5766_07705 [Candidatus Lumbricidophila eiseniae]